MKRPFAIFLVLLILSTNTGLAAGTHFCGGHLMATKLVLDTNNLTCGMEFMQKDCPTDDHGHTAFSRTPCCQNEVVELQVDDNYQKHTVQADLQTAALILILLFFPLANHRAPATIWAHPNAPPWKLRNLQINNQQFLI